MMEGLSTSAEALHQFDRDHCWWVLSWIHLRSQFLLDADLQSLQVEWTYSVLVFELSINILLKNSARSGFVSKENPAEPNNQIRVQFSCWLLWKVNCKWIWAIPDLDLRSWIESRICSRLPSIIIYSCFSYPPSLQLPAVGPNGEYFFMAQPINFSPVFGDGRVLP